MRMTAKRHRVSCLLRICLRGRRVAADAKIKVRRQGRVRRDRRLHQRGDDEKRGGKKCAQAFPACARHPRLDCTRGYHGVALCFFAIYVLRFFPFPPNWEGGRPASRLFLCLLQLRNTAAKMPCIGALEFLLILLGLRGILTDRRAAWAIAKSDFAKVWRVVAPGEEMTLSEDRDARVVAAINAAGADARCWPDALDEIARALNARFAALLFEDRVSALLELKHSTHAEKAWIVEYLRNHRKLDPVKARVLTEIGVGRAFSSQDFVSLKALHHSGAYQRWMAPFGLVDFVGGVIHRSETGACLFVAFRDACAGVADAAAKRRLDALLPLLADAIAHRVQSADASALEELFDELTPPVLVVDSKMRIAHRNRSADDILGEGDALAVAGDTLMMRDPRAREALERALAGSGGADAEAFAIMVKRGESRCCVMHVLPLANGLSVLFLRRLAPARDEGGAVAAELFGLTARERSVLLAIAEVGGVPATARALGLSEGTVKGYLKSIFQKTGATRQADLVKLVLALESPFRAPERHSPASRDFRATSSPPLERRFPAS